MKMLGFFVAAVVGLGGVAGGQPMSQTRDMGHPAGVKRPMTFADLMAMKRVSDPQVSASGKWVMFSVTDVSLEKNTKTNHLWVVPIGGRGERQMTLGTSNETNGRFSPDGRWVLYTSNVGGSSQLWLAPWDEAAGAMGSPRSPLTALSTEADGGVWSPDSKRVMFVSSVYPECSVKGEGVGGGPTHRDEAAMNGARGYAGLDPAEWAAEEACDKAKDEAAEKSPVKAQLWTSLLYRHWNAFTGMKRSHVLVVDVSDGLHVGEHVRDLTPASAVADAETPTFSLGGPLGYAWAPDSNEIAYVTNLDKVPAASTNNDVFTLRLDEAGAKAVKVSTSLGSDDGPSYSPDGKWLAFRSQARAGYESDKFRLMVMDRKSKSTRDLMPKFDRWVDEFVWAGDPNQLYFLSADRGEEPVYGVRFGESVSIERILGGGESSDLRVTPSTSDAVLVGMSLDFPPEIYVLGLVAGCGLSNHAANSASTEVVDECIRKSHIRQVTHLNGSLIAHLNGADSERFEFRGAEDTKVEGFIVRPPNFDPKKKYPVKFLIHGGPQGAWGDAWSYRWNPELMAASGYVVVMVNPRGSTGYGQAFIDGVNGDWGGKAYVDLMKGLDAAEAQFPFIDKDRECALGASYGGFMANWVLTHTNRFKCIVSHDGMYNPAAAYGDTEEMWFNEWEFRRPGDFPTGGSAGKPAQPWRYAAGPEDQDPFRKWSPMLHIQNAKTPTLVIHSQKDYRLDVSEGFQLFTALQRLGVPSEMLYFPDEGHWVMKPQNAELWNKTVGDWCDRWTKSNAYAGK